MAGLTVDDGVVPFPDTTTDFVKLLRERGIPVGYAVPREERTYVGHKAFELWLPILEFSYDLLVGLEAGLLVELLKTYVQPSVEQAARQESEQRGDETDEPEVSVPTILHVEWHVAKPDGERETFVANGGRSDVLGALEMFEQHVRDSEGS